MLLHIWRKYELTCRLYTQQMFSFVKYMCQRRLETRYSLAFLITVAFNCNVTVRYWSRSYILLASSCYRWLSYWKPIICLPELFETMVSVVSVRMLHNDVDGVLFSPQFLSVPPYCFIFEFSGTSEQRHCLK
jgi:hypothetical protein